MKNHVQQTRGGAAGHLLRRLVHLSMIVVPFLYYHLNLAVHWLFFVIAAIILMEAVRLIFKLQVFGQREHETKQISSFAWGGVSLCLVLLFAPEDFAYPIIAAFALGDPFIGELRRLGMTVVVNFLLSSVLIACIWGVAAYYFQFSEWFILMGPVTVLAENLRWRWIDDNATMQLIPLFAVLFLKSTNL